MPLFRRGETTAAEPSPAPLPDLTRELLDATITNITTILRAPESIFAPKRARASLVDALKQLDHFYPVVVEVERDEATRVEVDNPWERPAGRDWRGRPDRGARPGLDSAGQLSGDS